MPIVWLSEKERVKVSCSCKIFEANLPEVNIWNYFFFVQSHEKLYLSQKQVECMNFVIWGIMPLSAANRTPQMCHWRQKESSSESFKRDDQLIALKRKSRSQVPWSPLPFALEDTNDFCLSGVFCSKRLGLFSNVLLFLRATWDPVSLWFKIINMSNSPSVEDLPRR